MLSHKQVLLHKGTFFLLLFFFYCSFYRMQLSAHWWGFHDPHSGLSHYEWRAGTTPGSADILSSARIELSESALMFLSDSDQMRKNTDIYITVRAYNRVGLWSEASSNGFRVDRSPPRVKHPPVVDKKVGVIVKNTQVKVKFKTINIVCVILFLLFLSLNKLLFEQIILVAHKLVSIYM